MTQQVPTYIATISSHEELNHIMHFTDLNKAVNAFTALKMAGHDYFYIDFSPIETQNPKAISFGEVLDANEFLRNGVPERFASSSKYLVKMSPETFEKLKVARHPEQIDDFYVIGVEGYLKDAFYFSYQVYFTHSPTKVMYSIEFIADAFEGVKVAEGGIEYIDVIPF